MPIGKRVCVCVCVCVCVSGYQGRFEFASTYAFVALKQRGVRVFVWVCKRCPESIATLDASAYHLLVELT